MNRQLKLIKATEHDRVTLREMNINNLDYREMEGVTWIERSPVEVDECLYLFPVDQDGYLRTSTVQEIEETETELVVITRNSVYFFEVVKPEVN